MPVSCCNDLSPDTIKLIEVHVPSPELMSESVDSMITTGIQDDITKTKAKAAARAKRKGKTKSRTVRGNSKAVTKVKKRVGRMNRDIEAAAQDKAENSKTSGCSWRLDLTQGQEVWVIDDPDFSIFHAKVKERVSWNPLMWMLEFDDGDCYDYPDEHIYVTRDGAEDTAQEFAEEESLGQTPSAGFRKI